MSRLVDEALDAIGDGDPVRAADGILLAASFFEHSLGQTQGLCREEVLAEPASPADLRGYAGIWLISSGKGLHPRLQGRRCSRWASCTTPASLGSLSRFCVAIWTRTRACCIRR